MKNIQLSVLLMLGLQSMMSAAVELKNQHDSDRKQTIDQAIIDFPDLTAELNAVHQLYPEIHTWHDFLEEKLADENQVPNFGELHCQALAIATEYIKFRFIAMLDVAITENNTLNQFHDPIFKHVMQHKDDYMHDMFHSWLHEWSTTKDKNGYTPLHQAAYKNHTEVVSMLIKAGANVNIQNNKGWTPLYIASLGNNNVDVVRVLIDAGANVNIADKDNATPLHWASNPDIVKLLIAADANVNLQDVSGWAPLHFAARSNHNVHMIVTQSIKKIKILINAGADVNIQDKSGNTPLHAAFQSYNEKIAQMLINLGADRNIKNKDGKTADESKPTWMINGRIVDYDSYSENDSFNCNLCTIS